MRSHTLSLTALALVLGSCRSTSGHVTAPYEDGVLADEIQVAESNCEGLPRKSSQRDGFTIPVADKPTGKGSARDSFQVPGAIRPQPKPEGTDSFEIPSGPAVSWAVAGDSAFEDTLVIGTWNIKWFGQKDVDHYEYVTIADFVEECHVVAIQELCASNEEEAIQAILDELEVRGWNYDAVLSDFTGYDDNPSAKKGDYQERYAYIWHAGTIALKEAPSLVSTPPINNSTFRQVPFVADFQVLGASDFDFRLLTTHTVYNKKLHQTRRGEIQAIVNWVTSDPLDGEQHLIALGDFNANPPSQPSHFESVVQPGSEYRVLWYESRDAGEESIRTTVPTKGSSSNPTYFQLPQYDHVMLSAACSIATLSDEMTMGESHFGVWEFDNDPWWAENGWSRRDVISAVSDHRPMWFKLSFTTEDDD